MRNLFISSMMFMLVVTGCKEEIINHNYYGDAKLLQNDLLHGDLIGTVVQKNSGARVVVSQTGPIDSTIVNPVDGSFVFRNLRAGNYDLKILSNDYRHYVRSNIFVNGGSVVYAGEINLSTVPDFVASHYPLDKSEVVHDWRYGRITISILFTQPMDRESVEKAFSTSPPSEGIFVWGQYTRAPYNLLYYTSSSISDPTFGRPEPGATITTYSKVTSMTYVMAQKDSYTDSTYTVSLSTAAKDTGGIPLRFPLNFSFSTVQSYTTIYGIQTEPMHGDINVSPLRYGGIRLTFPRRMDPVSTETATTVTPSFNMAFLWPSGNVMTIYTGGAMPSDKTITVRVAPTALDKDGVQLGKEFEFSFRTAPFSVQYTNPRNAELFVHPTTSITLTFNSYVIKSSVQSAFSISPSVSGVFSYGGYSPYESKNQIVFSPSQALQLNTKYTVTVSTAAKDLYETPMKEAYSFSFVTRPE